MIKSDALTVTTSPVEITANIDTDGEYVLHVTVGTSVGNLSIGGADVSAGSWLAPDGSALTFRLQAGTRVYAVTDQGSKVVRVLAYSA